MTFYFSDICWLSDNENPDFRVEWIFDIRIYKLELVMNNVIEHCFSHVQYTCIEWCVYLIENSLGRSIANKLLAVFQISCLEVKSCITNQARLQDFEISSKVNPWFTIF